MERSRSIQLTVSVPVLVLAANPARRGYKIENTDASDALLVRSPRSPAVVDVTNVQTVSFSRTPTAGTFKLKFTNVVTGISATTAALAYNASTGTVQTAVRALTTLGLGSMTVGSADEGAGYKLTMTSVPLPDLRVEVVESTLAVAGVSEVQTITASEEFGRGVYRLQTSMLFGKVAAKVDTGDLAHSVDGSTLQTLLRSLLNDPSLAISGTLAAGTATITYGTKGPKPLIEARSRLRSVGVEVQAISFSADPTAGSFTLAIGEDEIGTFAFNDEAEDVETAIREIAGYEEVTVSGGFAAASPLVFTFEGVSGDLPFLVEVTANTLKDIEEEDVDLVASETRKGGDRLVTLSVARTTLGTEDVSVSASVTVNTRGDGKALNVSLAAGATLDRTATVNNGPVYALGEVDSSQTLKVTEYF
jgi:hypothetical protein